MTERKMIYLDDAINALESKKSKGEVSLFYNKIIQNDIDALMKLPPEQPEPAQWEKSDSYENYNDIDALMTLPSAHPEPAQWVKMLINPNMYKCSNCQVAWNKRFVFDNEGYSKNIFMKYCPCCGRKMKTEVGYE